MNVDLFFPSAVARGSFPEHLGPARTVMSEYLAKVPRNEWAVCQSEAMFDDRLGDLLKTIAQASYEMLFEQGYAMAPLQVTVNEFWGQEFTKGGQHIEHVHPRTAQISGFYFVDVPPKDSAHPIIFDPRPAKRQIALPQASMETVTYASEQIVFDVQPGDLLLMNSWLAHGFTRHGADQPFRFIHFNVGVEEHSHMNCCAPLPPEVI